MVILGDSSSTAGGSPPIVSAATATSTATDTADVTSTGLGGLGPIQLAETSTGTAAKPTASQQTYDEIQQTCDSTGYSSKNCQDAVMSNKLAIAALILAALGVAGLIYFFFHRWSRNRKDKKDIKLATLTAPKV